MRGEANSLPDALVQGALGDQQTLGGLAAPSVLLDHDVAVILADEPLLKYLALFLAQVRPAAVRQRRENVPRAQQRLPVSGPDTAPVDLHRANPFPAGH